MLTFNVISHAGYAIISLFLIYIYRKNKALTIFNICTLICYTLSTLHHIFPANQDFAQLDYVGIYILIVGTYLAVFKNTYIIIGVIAIAIFFSTLQILHTQVYPVGYLLAGWISALGATELLEKFSRKGLTLFILGGILYTVGEAINLTKLDWAHEVFHVFVISGTLCHLRTISGENRMEKNTIDSYPTYLYAGGRVPIGRGRLGKSEATLEWKWYAWQLNCGSATKEENYGFKSTDVS